MNYTISPEIMSRLIDASQGTLFRLQIENDVGRRFKSTRYVTIKRLVDGIVLNLLLNDKITPTSANEALSCVQSHSRSFYLSVEHEYSLIKDKFLKYAADVVDNLDEILALDLRTVNFVVYVLTLDISKRYKFNREEVFMRAFSYEELYDIMPYD